LVHARIDRLTDLELAQVERQLDLLEMKRGFDELRDQISSDWDSGVISEGKVTEAIKAYRGDSDTLPRGFEGS
jgi:hypothetical protein